MARYHLRSLLTAALQIGAAVAFMGCGTETRSPAAPSQSRMSAEDAQAKASVRIAGIVVDEEKRPLEGAFVACYGRLLTTDADGRFDFGEVEVYANFPVELRASHPAHAPQVVHRSPDPAAPIHQEFRLLTLTVLTADVPYDGVLGVDGDGTWIVGPYDSHHLKPFLNFGPPIGKVRITLEWQPGAGAIAAGILRGPDEFVSATGRHEFVVTHTGDAPLIVGRVSGTGPFSEPLPFRIVARLEP